MKRLSAAALLLCLGAAAGAQTAQDMTITRAGSQASSKGPVANFTGSVRVDPLFPAHASASTTSGAYVTFEPGARSAWHSHPQGQVPVVTAVTHLAIQDAVDGKNVEWMEKVTDEQYGK